MSFSEREMTIKPTLECVLFEKFAFYSESNGIALMRVHLNIPSYFGISLSLSPSLNA